VNRSEKLAAQLRPYGVVIVAGSVAVSQGQGFWPHCTVTWSQTDRNGVIEGRSLTVRGRRRADQIKRLIEGTEAMLT
jgi:hypothetical protein